jgi:hypothetical protein
MSLIAPYDDIRELALELAIADKGKGEVGGNNRGEWVERVLRNVGAKPGDPWCCGFVVWEYNRACGQFEVPLILPRTAACRVLIQEVRLAWLRPDPVRGAIAVRLNNIEDPKSRGHVGIVLDYRRSGHVVSVDGNTDNGNDQDGQSVAERTRPEAYWNAGYIYPCSDPTPV